MEALTLRQLAVRAVLVGASLAWGVIGALALRSAYAVTSGHRWYQARELGIGVLPKKKES